MDLLNKTLFLLGASAFLLMPLSSKADDASKNKEIAQRFAKCDINKDGKLTAHEAKGCMPRVYSHFSYIDSEGRGYVTLAQIQAIADR
ncbi:MAG: hypothetical protein RL517_715 [Pseudomonadota bacterium]|jgi:hypothetical protein